MPRHLLAPLFALFLAACAPAVVDTGDAGPHDRDAALLADAGESSGIDTGVAPSDAAPADRGSSVIDASTGRDAHSPSDAGSHDGPVAELDAAGSDGTDAGQDAERDAGLMMGLPYPDLDTIHIKGIQPDFWPDKSLFVANATGSVAVNLVWDTWEAIVATPPCNPSTQEEYDGHCFNISQGEDNAIREYTALGIKVVAIVYGTPAWARVGNTGCSPYSPAFERFCSPDDAIDYARFAGMLARRYDGQGGHGRVADFVIHNEVNSNIWFDIGCGQGTPCDIDAWIRIYAESYAAAYDQIKSHQSAAKVMLSFDHHFDTEFDQPAEQYPLISVKTFVTRFAAQIGERDWMIAYHSYPPNLLEPGFGPADLPRVTFGNLGVIVAWLRASFPNDPHAWEIQLTENGINSSSPNSSEAAQADGLCKSFVNVLGTPGVRNYIYHRMRDHADEGELHLGLTRPDGSFKPAWSVWAGCNHSSDISPQLSCGFEDLPNIRLRRSRKDFNLATRHWASTRLAPDGFVEEDSWLLRREKEPGTHLLFECMAEHWLYKERSFLSFDISCGGKLNLGPVGYIYDSPRPGTVPLYRCATADSSDQFISQDPGCEGKSVEQLLGYAIDS